MTREEIVEGLKRWARGSLPAQTAVTFVAATNEPLDRMWVIPDPFREGNYYLDWDAFDMYSGGLSGGEYATWALARSLHRGELDDHLFRLDPARQDAFAQAIARCREQWSYDE
jgi:hypothetical protein